MNRHTPLQIILCTAMIVSAMQITNYTAYTTPADYLSQYLGTDGIVIENAFLTATFDPEIQFSSAGTFTGGEAINQGNSIMNEGVVLSSGYVNHLQGNSNVSDNMSGYLAAGGDPDLDALLDQGITSRDATALEFDFHVAEEGTFDLSLSYIFGSDEYDEYALSSYTDLFGIFVNERGNTEKLNIATIPGTSTPVSIGTINLDNNSSMYHSNDLTDYPDGNTPFSNEMDGFTDPFTASFTASGNTLYHLKIAVADAAPYDSDERGWDSWLLLGAHSFTYAPHAVPEPSAPILLFTGLILSALLFIKKRRS